MRKKINTDNVQVYPAIDLLDNKVVRLYKGSYSDVRVYHHDPLTLIREFEELGAECLHLVDLNAARTRSRAISEGKISGGKSAQERRVNRKLIMQICKNTRLWVEVGGGIRNNDDVQELADCAVSALVVGTAIVHAPDRVANWVQKHNLNFIAGVDALGGEVRVAGWEESADISVEEMIRRVESLGLAGIIYTNISKDGTLEGPDIEGSMRIARLSQLPVRVSGGISNLEDCRRVCRASKLLKNTTTRTGSGTDSGWIDGFILGRALYEGRVDLGNCIQMVKNFRDTK